MSADQHIARRASQGPVRPFCQVLRTATCPAAYYAWQHQPQVPAVETAWQVAVRDLPITASATAMRRLQMEVRVGDVTYLPRQGSGGRYLAVWLGRCSRKVVGWDVRQTMSGDLVGEALCRALAVRQPPAGLVVHSDQGNQHWPPVSGLTGAPRRPTKPNCSTGDAFQG